MVILRPTVRLRKHLPLSTDSDATSGTALGDWYVNRIVVDRRPLLLLVSSTSLLAALVPARDVRRFPERLGDVVAQRLGRLGVSKSLIDAELGAMTEVGIAKTVDRSVLGITVDYAGMLRYMLDPGFAEHEGLMEAEELLWENPCHAGRSFDQVVFPRKKAPEVLKARWAAV
jgi:hypothetical protein